MTGAPRFGLRNRLSIAFGLALLVAVAVSLFSIMQLQSMNRLATALTETWMPQRDLLGDLGRAIAEHHQLAARRVAAADSRQLAGIDTGIEAVRRSIAEASQAYLDLADSDEERAAFRVFRDRWQDYENSLLEVGRLLDQDAVAEGTALFDSDSREAFRQADTAMDRLLQISKEDGIEGAALAHAAYQRILVVSVAALVFSALMLAVSLAWIVNNVARPILRVSEAMQRLTEGDASVTISGPRERKDEIGVLISAVDGYRRSLLRGRELAAEAEMERQRLATAIANMPVGLVMFDAQQRLIIANARYAEMYRLPPEMARPGTTLHEVLEHRVRTGNHAGPDPDAYIQYLEGLIRRKKPVNDIIQFRDGRIFSLIYQPMEDGGWVSTHEDLTDRRKAQAQIAHMTLHDQLTDLPNRTLVRQRIEEALQREEADESPIAVLCLDLDHFKEVNDTLGHPIGDKLLQTVGARLLGMVRQGDTVARFGGDAFAVVQVGAEQPKGARALANRIIEEISAPFMIEGHEVVLSVSVGIALSPGDGNNANTLLKNGDMALYRAKADGRGLYRFFEPEMDARMQTRRVLELDLRRAVTESEFELHYQPQRDAKTLAIVGFEALLRWRHPQRGMISPGDFIPLAEETGLIVPIGEWVMRQACTDAVLWPAHVRVAVNLSPMQFRNVRLLQTVVNALAASGLAPSRLELEITESALISDMDSTLATLHQLRELGARISMDDFGTGYSSLSNLQSFPFDKIKIDQSFIRNIARDRSSLAIIRAVTGLSASLGVATTAEGVETRDQLDRVRAEGCSEVQGFLTGRPQPLANTLALLDSDDSDMVAA